MRVTFGKFLFVTMLAGCQGTDPGCDVCTTSAVVLGRVYRSPVAGAALEVEARAADCSGEPRHTFLTVLPGPPPPRTAADGGYELWVRSTYTPSACLRVRVEPPAGAALSAATTEGVQVEFRADYPYPPPPRDSARVDLTLPPS